MTPRSGSSSGGVVVVVAVRPASSASSRGAAPACDVGTVRVAARASLSGYECVVPAADPDVGATAPVRLTVIGADLVPEAAGILSLGFEVQTGSASRHR